MKKQWPKSPSFWGNFTAPNWASKANDQITYIQSIEISFLRRSDMHEIENNSRKVMTSTFPPHCLNFPELSYHKISYKILQVIGWSWRFPYHHFTLSLAKPLWVYGRQCRIRVEAEETWMVFHRFRGDSAAEDWYWLHLLWILWTCCKSFLFSMETAGKMDVISYHRHLSSIFSLHSLSSMYILCCLTYSGIPEYLYRVSLSFLYPPDHWPCSFHWLWFQMKPATAEHILSCSHVVQVFFSSAKACFQSFSLSRRFQKNLGQHRTHPSVFSAPMISEASPKLLQTLWQLWQIFSPPKPRLEWCHGSH